jgi:hypothetical protein
VESAFGRNGVLLDNTGLYSSSDRPIIRSYAISQPGQLWEITAGVLVYAAVRDAVAAERLRPSKNVVPKNASRPDKVIRRANVIVLFWRGATTAERRRVTSALQAVGH